MDKDRIEHKKKLMEQLQDKKYRDAFISEHIDQGISFQIRALRKRGGWTQKKLSEQTGMAQERISVAENPNYSSFNIKTLKRIASAFDVALIVRFVPVGELVNWELNLSSETLAPPSFEKDPYFQLPVYTHVAQRGLVLGGENIANFINPLQNVRHLQPKLNILPGGKKTDEKMDESQKEIEKPLQIKMMESQFQQVGGMGQ